jgi:hypothetical protein
MYDLESDPKEMNNIYGNEKYKDIQEALELRLFELRHEYQDTIGIMN